MGCNDGMGRGVKVCFVFFFAFKNFNGMFAEGLPIGDEVDQNIGIEKHF
jgi:hypothetical protein